MAIKNFLFFNESILQCTIQNEITCEESATFHLGFSLAAHLLPECTAATEAGIGLRSPPTAVMAVEEGVTPVRKLYGLDGGLQSLRLVPSGSALAGL